MTPYLYRLARLRHAHPDDPRSAWRRLCPHSWSADVPRGRSLRHAVVEWANQCAGWYDAAPRAARILGARDIPPFDNRADIRRVREAADYVQRHAPPTRAWNRRRALCRLVAAWHERQWDYRPLGGRPCPTTPVA